VLGFACGRGLEAIGLEGGRDPVGANRLKASKLEPLASDQVRLPPELKHINKARNRNQQGFPQ
jgi:hypothetical protein